MAENDEDEEEGYGPGNRRYWEDRWTVLHELSPEELAHPSTRRLHLEAAVKLQKWDAMKLLAGAMVISEESEDRHLAAQALLDLARRESKTGDMKAAHDNIGAAIHAWPEAKEEVSKDRELSMYLPR